MHLLQYVSVEHHFHFALLTRVYLRQMPSRWSPKFSKIGSHDMAAKVLSHIPVK